ncbi:hypothetical protein FZI91_17800 [Mycobacterium sp. CBMA271]|uniref:hypothetical protein n=1 Tax=unclassified Mycobacteroides TaxID=2618759 RepID=UPI0012DFD89A|nr:MULTISPECIES: hypothetical protein [unclassified Mycobacteroides]MUM23541.1 hypothetical protein [Mycobacteroides sp. CBMA 271]
MTMSRERTEPSIEDFPPFQEAVSLTGLALTTSAAPDIDRLLAVDILLTTLQDRGMAREMYPDGTSPLKFGETDRGERHADCSVGPIPEPMCHVVSCGGIPGPDTDSRKYALNSGGGGI